MHFTQKEVNFLTVSYSYYKLSLVVEKPIFSREIVFVLMMSVVPFKYFHFFCETRSIHPYFMYNEL